MKVWRIVTRHIDDQEWKHLGSKIYFTKGTASGVMKRHGDLEKHNWDATEKVWVHPNGKILYKLQCATVDWEGYESI